MKSLTNKQPLYDVKNIGLAIWTAIEKSGMSREEISDALSVSVRTVNYWQDGSKKPSVDNAIRLAILLGCSLDSLLLL